MQQFWSEIRAFLLLCTIFIFVFAIDISIVYMYYSHVDNFINSQPTNVKADAGVIFFGDYLEDGLDIGPNSKNRANAAINLYKSEKISNVICVGGYYFKTWKGKPHHMRNYLVKNGVLQSDIIHDSLSFNTITNWQEGKKIINNKGFDKIIAISDPLHIFRISLMIQDTNVYYASYQYNFTGIQDYWVFFKDVHHEFMSHIMSFLFHEKLRNKIVYTYRSIKLTAKKIFY